MPAFSIQEVDGGVVFTVKVVPGSSKTCVAGVLGDMLKVKVSAAPEKGKASDCLISFLATQIGVKSKTIQIMSGKTNPVKQVRVEGLTAELLTERLGL